jgi:hypothetical protein
MDFVAQNTLVQTIVRNVWCYERNKLVEALAADDLAASAHNYLVPQEVFIRLIQSA